MTSFFYVVSYCHLSATLQTISNTVVNLQDNRAVFRIFIALLRFSVDCPSYFVCISSHAPSRKGQITVTGHYRTVGPQY